LLPLSVGKGGEKPPSWGNGRGETRHWGEETKKNYGWTEQYNSFLRDVTTPVENEISQYENGKRGHDANGGGL